jgi:secreted PhoX family phosphatase
LQALQVLRDDGTPMDTASSLLSQDIKDLHKPGSSFATRWVTVHDTTAANATQTFCGSTAAKAANATPFKRPENGVFRPGTRFGEFYFTETGDTNADSVANSDAGGWGGIFRITQNEPSADTGRVNLVALGNADHTSFDNLSFATRDLLLVVEDRGDGLHSQHNALDSGWAYDVSGSRPGAAAAPVRFLAEGRDAAATIDSALLDAKVPGFQNDGDNEVTGIHVSDGDPGVGGLLGAKTPHPFREGWRIFWTAQHGDNVTFEIVANDRSADDHR